jgi:hypothetical protein
MLLNHVKSYGACLLFLCMLWSLCMEQFCKWALEYPQLRFIVNTWVFLYLFLIKDPFPFLYTCIIKKLLVPIWEAYIEHKEKALYCKMFNEVFNQSLTFVIYWIFCSFWRENSIGPVRERFVIENQKQHKWTALPPPFPHWPKDTFLYLHTKEVLTVDLGGGGGLVSKTMNGTRSRSS